jgi:Protein of unknown function (DUF2877)
VTVSLIAVDYSRPILPIFKQRERAGTIHSVFQNAMNIVLDGSLLAVLSDALPRMPNSLRMPSSMVSDFLALMRPGMEVRVANNTLYIPYRDISIHLPETPAWEPRPNISAYRWDRKSVNRHTHLLTHFLAEKGLQCGLAPLIGPLFLEQPNQETPLSRMAMPNLRLLAQASWQQDNAGIKEAIRGLAGLGPGLTPSGDDVLGGFAAIMALLSPQLSADVRSRKYIASTIAEVAKTRTTILSAVLLGYASRGEVAEHIGGLLLALTLPIMATNAVLDATDHVLTFGASSGGDTLLGILLGLHTLEGEKIKMEDTYGHTSVAQA